MEYNKWKITSLDDLGGEIWNPVPGYEYTHASNFGRIKSGDRWVMTRGSSKRYVKMEIRRQFLSKDGYLRCMAVKDGRLKKVTSHRMCALAFIPNPENKKTVQHGNHIRHCNESWNLSWMTSTEQNRESIASGRRVMSGDWLRGKKGKDHPRHKCTGSKNAASIPVIQYTLSGIKIKEWESIGLAEKGLRIHGIGAYLRKGKKIRGGFIWEKINKK